MLNSRPGPRGASSHVAIRIGERYADSELGDIDRFLTARFRLFSAAGEHHRSARAAHDPWPLHRAEVIDLRDELVRASGLPQPAGPPLVHFSPGVHVRIGRPEPYAGPGMLPDVSTSR